MHLETSIRGIGVMFGALQTVSIKFIDDKNNLMSNIDRTIYDHYHIKYTIYIYVLWCDYRILNNTLKYQIYLPSNFELV